MRAFLKNVRQFLGSHETLLSRYGSTLTLLARIQAAAGLRRLALFTILRAWRAAGSRGIGSRSAALAEQWIAATFRQSGRLPPIADNPLLAEFQRSDEARSIRREFATYPVTDRVRLRYPREPDDPERQGDLIVLKRSDAETGERGVLLINYTEGIRRFAAMFDLSAVASRYIVVLEPSWWGYQDSTFLILLGDDLDVVVQCPWREDYEFIERLRSNLVPTRLGAGDWVDPAVFTAGTTTRSYDLVMVSSWSPAKRHADLFRAMRELKHLRNGRLRVALIGYPAAWTMKDIERLAVRHGVRDYCEFFQSVTPAEVARIVGDSRLYVLLSRKEGANRALYEAMFCDTPAVVYRHHRGVNTENITERTGVLFEDDTLASSINEALARSSRFSPREWALENTGYLNSTARLNEIVRGMAARRGTPWTRQVTAKKNVPNAVYARRGEYVEFAAEYDTLAQFLLEAD